MSNVTNEPASDRAFSNVAHLLAISPVVVTVVSIVAVTVLGIDRVLHASDIVTVLLGSLGAHQALAALQSSKRAG